MSVATREMTGTEAADREPPLRFVTAASLFDGHDAAINIMRRLIQSKGAEVIHLGHNRSVADVVRAAIQEDADGIAISSYQGGHTEYFRYMVDMLRDAGAEHIRVFGGGGGTITPEEIRELMDYGVERIYHPNDGMKLGLDAMIEERQSDPRAWRRGAEVLTRIPALRPAAVEFVNTVFDSFEPGSVSMSLVPYSTQVNVGEDILDAFPGMNRYHNYSHCANLTSAMYDEVGFDMATSIDQTAHFDADSYSYNRSYWGASRFVCNPDPNSEVIAHAHEPGMLTTRINQLQPYEWTSIEMGAKWGLALLDPSTADITAYLESQGVVDQLVDDRPLEYGGDSMKVMVLMTDGENTQSYELDPPYRTGLSDVYIDDDTGLYYVEDEEQGNKDWDGSYWEDWYRPDYDNWTNGIPWDARQLTWPELFDRINVDGHAWYFRAEQYGSGHNFNSWYSGIFETTYSSTKNTRLLALCDLAKEQGIVIFTIGFQVPAAADTVMESCASSPSYYYDVDDLDIDEAFTSIATQISALRLIQ